MDFPKSVTGVGLVDGKFVDENQATGQVGSLIPAAWGNAVTDELLAVIAAAGLVPSEQNNAQLISAINALIAGAADPWALQPVGVPVAVLSHLEGVAAPPTNKAYRYIKLSASDAYNAGVLGSETLTGAAPLISATAVIALPGSPINGRTVNLINTESRFLRASATSGELLNDAFQGHHHTLLYPFTGSFGGGLTIGLSTQSSSGILSNTATAPISDGANGAPRVANETRPKSIGVTYFMRVK